MSLENLSINSFPRPLVSHPKIKYDPFSNSFAYKGFLDFVEKKTVEASVGRKLRIPQSFCVELLADVSSSLGPLV